MPILTISFSMKTEQLDPKEEWSRISEKMNTGYELSSKGFYIQHFVSMERTSSEKRGIERVLLVIFSEVFYVHCLNHVVFISSSYRRGL